MLRGRGGVKDRGGAAGRGSGEGWRAAQHALEVGRLLLGPVEQVQHIFQRRVEHGLPRGARHHAGVDGHEVPAGLLRLHKRPRRPLLQRLPNGVPHLARGELLGVVPGGLIVNVVRGHVLLENGGAAAGEHHAAEGGAARARARREHRLCPLYRGLHEKGLAQLRRARRHDKGARRVEHHAAARNGGVKRGAVAQQVRLKQGQPLRAGQRAQVARLGQRAHRAIHAQAARKQGGNQLGGDEARGASDAHEVAGVHPFKAALCTTQKAKGGAPRGTPRRVTVGVTARDVARQLAVYRLATQRNPPPCAFCACALLRRSLPSRCSPRSLSPLPPLRPQRPRRRGTRRECARPRAPLARQPLRAPIERARREPSA